MKVYDVWYGSYSDRDLDSIWLDKQKVQKYIRSKNVECKDKIMEWEHFPVEDEEQFYEMDKMEIEEYEVKE
jgi:hypothetical protein